MIDFGSNDNIFGYFNCLLNKFDDINIIRVKIELIELLKIKIKQFSRGNSSVSKERGKL